MAEISQEMVKQMKPFEGPIPGQSLTNPVESNHPWQKPPKFVTVKDSLDNVFSNLMQKEKLLALVEMLSEGTYDVVTVTQVLLEKGWRDGKWDTQLMLLLAEPVMIIIMAIAEKAGIRDYEIFEGDNQELDEEEADKFTKDISKDMKQKMTFKGMEMPPVKKESVSPEILEAIESSEIPQASLLNKPAT